MASKVEIGERIRKLREGKNLTQKELADELFVKRETINAWENAIRDIKTEYTDALASFFGVSCDYIIRGVEAENIDACNRTGLSEKAVINLSSLRPDTIMLDDDGAVYSNYPKYLHHKLINCLIEDEKTTYLLSNLAGAMIKVQRNEDTEAWLKKGGIYFEVHRVIAAFLDSFCEKYGDEVYREYMLFKKEIEERMGGI